MARIIINDDGSFTFSQIDLSNPLDSDVPVIEGENGEIEIDCSRLAEGKYIIRITTDNCIYTATAIKI